MFKPELYQKANLVTRKDALDCLEKYASKIKWRTDDSIMDLGCGDGSVTTSILKKFMHSDFKKLVGSDISETMIKYANEQHGDERTVFMVLDMGGDLTKELRSSFEHVFSFYAIHWVHKQESVFANIHNLLKKGGDCFLVFIGYTAVYDIWRALSRQAKWQQWLCNVDYFVSPYQDIQEPENDVREIMLDKGFKNIDVKCIEKTFLYDLELFKKTMEAILPFKIPPERRVDFIKDFIKVAHDLHLMEKIDDEDETVVRIDYSLIVVYGNK